jgi:hypothetical protein
VAAAEYVQKPKGLGTAPSVEFALEMVVGPQQLRSVLQPIVCLAFRGPIGSKGTD